MEFSPDLIPALPGDIAHDCLHRVAVKAHPTLRQVCRSWNSLASKPKFYETRQKLGYAGDYACFLQSGAEDEQQQQEQQQQKKKTGKAAMAICYGVRILEVESGDWSRVHSMPEFLLNKKGLPQFSQCVAVGREMVIVGGWDAETWEVMRTVYRLDMATGRWRKGADMPRSRSFFGCATMGEGKIVVAGGHDADKNALRTADIYDLVSDRWAEMPDMAEERDECKALAGTGGVVVVSGFATHSQGRFSLTAERFDAAAGKWELIDGAWIGGRSSPSSIVATPQGSLYAVVDGKLIRSPSQPPPPASGADRRHWETVSPLPSPLHAVPCATTTYLEKSGSILVASLGPSPSLWRFHCPSQSWNKLNGGSSGILQASSCTVHV